MLNKDMKKRIIEEIKKVISELRIKTIRDVRKGVSSEKIINEMVKITVNRLTPESKIILNKVYNALKNETLKNSLYNNIQHKRAFYDKDILGQLNQKYHFEIPQNIDYKSCNIKMNKLEKAGAIVVSGGVISFVVSSYIPVSIAIIIAGLMVFNGGNMSNSNEEIINVIDNYYKNVEMALLNWIGSIEKFYDQQVQEIENSF